MQALSKLALQNFDTLSSFKQIQFCLFSGRSVDCCFQSFFIVYQFAIKFVAFFLISRGQFHSFRQNFVFFSAHASQGLHNVFMPYFTPLKRLNVFVFQAFTAFSIKSLSWHDFWLCASYARFVGVNHFFTLHTFVNRLASVHGRIRNTAYGHKHQKNNFSHFYS